jgi:hypothetical protein
MFAWPLNWRGVRRFLGKLGPSDVLGIGPGGKFPAISARRSGPDSRAAPFLRPTTGLRARLCHVLVCGGRDAVHIQDDERT